MVGVGRQRECTPKAEEYKHTKRVRCCEKSEQMKAKTLPLFIIYDFRPADC